MKEKRQSNVKRLAGGKGNKTGYKTVTKEEKTPSRTSKKVCVVQILIYYILVQCSKKREGRWITASAPRPRPEEPRYHKMFYGRICAPEKLFYKKGDCTFS